MSYIKEFEMELEKKLQGSEDKAVLSKWILEKVKESYMNGLALGRKRGNGRRSSFPAESSEA
jgi:hypothetical protein